MYKSRFGLARKWQKMLRLKTLMAMLVVLTLVQGKSKKLRKEANNLSKETDRLTHVNILYDI